jgi:NitT/TauT family transport system substrate-binding protein
LLVAADSTIKSLADLKGKKLGIAGGELDKNWLLLQALGLQQGIDLNQSVEKVFGAPPLLNQQLTSKRIDAVLTYWQFAARLEAEGYQQLLSGEQIISQLGVKSSVPSLGYVFKQSWANQHKAALQQFLTTTHIARDKLCNDDAAWQQIIGLTETDDPTSQQLIRQRYCQGRVTDWGVANQKAAETVYGFLSKLGDNKLTGKSGQLQAGTFWSAD